MHVLSDHKCTTSNKIKTANPDHVQKRLVSSEAQASLPLPLLPSSFAHRHGRD